jgi:hypothetical protein
MKNTKLLSKEYSNILLKFMNPEQVFLVYTVLVYQVFTLNE